MALWAVEVLTEIVVCADSKEDAEKVANDLSRDIFSNEEFDFTSSINPIERVEEGMTFLPVGWEESARPYGGSDKTIGEILDKESDHE